MKSLQCEVTVQRDEERSEGWGKARRVEWKHEIVKKEPDQIEFCGPRLGIGSFISRAWRTSKMF